MPAAEARALVEDAERSAIADGCRPCGRAYVVQLCRGDRCVQVCNDAFKRRLSSLRQKYLVTRTASNVDLLH